MLKTDKYLKKNTRQCLLKQTLSRILYYNYTFWITASPPYVIALWYIIPSAKYRLYNKKRIFEIRRVIPEITPGKQTNKQTNFTFFNTSIDLFFFQAELKEADVSWKTRNVNCSYEKIRKVRFTYLSEERMCKLNLHSFLLSFFFF